MVLFVVETGGFEQEKLEDNDLTESKSETPAFNEATSIVKTAMENVLYKDLAKTWYAAGMIENKQFEAERNKQILGQKPDQEKMYGALFNTISFFEKAVVLDMQPDVKGKVKSKYAKEIKNTVRGNQLYFYNAGGYFWDKKDYPNAYNMFKTYAAIPQLEMFKGETFPVDTNLNTIQFYTAIAASQIPNHKLAAEEYAKLKGTGYKPNEVYQYLAYEYQQLGDTVAYEQVLVDGAKEMPNEPFFVQTLINLYINRSQYDDAVVYLENAIKQDPSNAQFYDVKGRLLESMKQVDEAIESFKKAIEVNSEYAEAYADLGRVYYNRAIDVDNGLNQKTYDKEFDEKVKPLYLEAIPHFEKAYALNNQERNSLVALRQMYYKLKMYKDYERIEAEMNK